MKKSELTAEIKSYIYELLAEEDIDETTMVGPKTDPNKSVEIAKNEKTDPLTVKAAINKAKTTNTTIGVA